MSYSTIYFDLTNRDDIDKLNTNTVDEILLSNESEDLSGAVSPFYMIFKMNGLFLKRKPDFWKLLNKFQETPYPLKFITVFVDESPKNNRPVIHLSQELQKDNLRIFWIPDSRGLEIDGQAVPRAIGRWEKDPEGNLALDEFIEILKIPEVFQDSIEKTSSQKVYIPGYKKLRVGFGDEKDNFDVFFKAINSITGNINPANLPAIIFHNPSETVIGSDLQGSDFIENQGLLANNINEILTTQRKLLYLFGIIKDKSSPGYKNMLKRVKFSIKDYKEEMSDIEKNLSKKIDELSDKLSSVEALSGLSNEDINKLMEVGINITAKSSEFENQQDLIIETVWNEIIQNLKNGYSFEALMSNIDTEIDVLKPKNNKEITEKVKEVKEAKIFKNLNDIEAHMPKILKSLLGGPWTKLLLVRNYIIASIAVAILLFSTIQVSLIRNKCAEELGIDLSSFSSVEFVTQFIVDQDKNNILADRCRATLPTATSEFYFNYETMMELKSRVNQARIDYNNNQINYEELQGVIEAYNQILSEYSQKLINVNRLFLGVVSLYIPLLIYGLLTLLSVLLMFITNAQIKNWGNNLGLKQFETVSKKLKQNIEDIVLNDIKFGQLRHTLSNQMLLYKNLIVEIQDYVENSEDSFMKLETETNDDNGQSGEIVNPKYVQKVTPIAQGQSMGMFDRVVNISRSEIIEMLTRASNKNISKLFGRNPENFKDLVFQEFQNDLSSYIAIIKTKGILEIEDSTNKSINAKKEELKSEIWKNDSIIKEPLEKIIDSNKNDLTMQMISSTDIDLLDRQNTEWRFLKFLPKSTINWFSVLANSSSDSDYTLTEFSETAGYIRLIPINRNSMDVVQ